MGLLQRAGGGGEKILIAVRQVHWRVVVGLQVHGRNVTYFTIVSVVKKKTNRHE